MSFQRYFKENKVPEWKKLYINLKLLENILKTFGTVLKYKPSLKFDFDKNDDIVRTQYLQEELTSSCRSKLDELLKIFTTTFISQMEKVNEFFLLYTEKLQIDTSKLIYNFSELKKDGSTINYQILKETSCNLYTEAKYLNNYCLINRQAAKYLLDQLMDQTSYMEESLRYWFEITSKYETLKAFTDEEQIIIIKDDIQNAFIPIYTPGNQQLGITYLKTNGKRKYFSKIYSCVFGIFSAAVIFLNFNLILNYFEYNFSHDESLYNLYFPMFRCQGLFIMYYWFLAINVYGWQNAFINYRHLFHFNQHYSSPPQIFTRCAIFSSIFMVMFLVCMSKINYENQQKYSLEDDFQENPLMNLIFFDPALGPLILWIIFFIYLFFPSLKYFNGEGRKYFIIVVLQTLISPFYIQEFRHVFVGGQFFSFVRPFKDLDYTVCFYTKYFSNPSHEYHALKECSNSKNINMNLIAAIFPIILKWMQLGRSAYNKKKFLWTDQMYYCIRYLFTFFTAIFSYLSANYHQIYFWLWIIAATLSAAVSFYFDVKKDWGFLVPNKHYRFLRKNLAYDYPSVYYAIIVIDLPLRFSWALSVSPNIAAELGIWSPFWIMIIASLELFRRCLWNFIRVEREHLTNEGEFRAIPALKFPYKISEADQKMFENQFNEANYQKNLKKFKNYLEERHTQIPGQMKKVKQDIKTLSREIETEMKLITKQERKEGKSKSKSRSKNLSKDSDLTL